MPQRFDRFREKEEVILLSSEEITRKPSFDMNDVYGLKYIQEAFNTQKEESPIDSKPLKKREVKQARKQNEVTLRVETKKKGKCKYNKWTEQEEDIFIEAVRLFGKDMKKVSERVGRGQGHCQSKG